MAGDYNAFWVFIIIMVFYMLASILRAMDSKFKIINKKLDSVRPETKFLAAQGQDGRYAALAVRLINQ